MPESDDQFEQFLSARRGQTVYMKPYWGNSGDMLIWLGMEEMLRRLGLVQVLDPRRAEIILWPGGNPTMWDLNIKGWQDCWERWPHAQFVVAPATFQRGMLPWPELLESTNANIAGLFARDAQSLQILQGLKLKNTTCIGIGHDPAFEMRHTQWIRDSREACTREYVLAGFRDDHESTHGGAKIGHSSLRFPLSAVYDWLQKRKHERAQCRQMEAVARASSSKLPIKWRDASLLSFHAFVECVARADEVHTDRLHCMIMATLLEKKVFAYPTLYSKLEGVYEQSIKSWANVTFVKS